MEFSVRGEHPVDASRIDRFIKRLMSQPMTESEAEKRETRERLQVLLKLSIAAREESEELPLAEALRSPFYYWGPPQPPRQKLLPPKTEEERAQREKAFLERWKRKEEILAKTRLDRDA